MTARTSTSQSKTHLRTVPQNAPRVRMVSPSFHAMPVTKSSASVVATGGQSKTPRTRQTASSTGAVPEARVPGVVKEGREARAHHRNGRVRANAWHNEVGNNRLLPVYGSHCTCGVLFFPSHRLSCVLRYRLAPSCSLACSLLAALQALHIGWDSLIQSLHSCNPTTCWS